MIIETNDFGLKTLASGKFLGVPCSKKRLREGDRVCIVWEFDVAGWGVHITRGRNMPAARWRCRRCKQDVDLKADRPCGCKTGPSPWYIV